MRTIVAACALRRGLCTGRERGPDRPGEEAAPQEEAAKVDPKTFRPDEATLKQIQEKTEELRKAVAALKEKKIADDVLVEVEIYLKAAENIVRFEEWLHANSVRWALQTLDQGLERAKLAEGGKAVWRDAPGKWVVRAYRSHIDDSIQPYAVLLPHDYGKDPNKKWRLDIVLHGRDSALTEAKFIATHGTTAKEAPKDSGLHPTRSVRPREQCLPLGGRTGRVRGSSMIFERSAKDVRSNRQTVSSSVGSRWAGPGRGTSGCTTRSDFCVIGPGAGFTTTHGYIANLPKRTARLPGEVPAHLRRGGLRRERVQRAGGRVQRREGRAEEGGRQHRERAEGLQGTVQVHAPRRAGSGTPDAEGVAGQGRGRVPEVRGQGPRAKPGARSVRDVHPAVRVVRLGRAISTRWKRRTRRPSSTRRATGQRLRRHDEQRPPASHLVGSGEESTHRRDGGRSEGRYSRA